MLKGDKKSSKSKAKKEAATDIHDDFMPPQDAGGDAPLDETPPAKSTKNDKGALTVTLNKQFQAVRETLSSTTNAKKQPRQLRWALKTLAMAEEAAARAVTHAE